MELPEEEEADLFALELPGALEVAPLEAELLEPAPLESELPSSSPLTQLSLDLVNLLGHPVCDVKNAGYRCGSKQHDDDDRRDSNLR
jgi:hypothetical protein